MSRPPTFIASDDRVGVDVAKQYFDQLELFAVCGTHSELLQVPNRASRVAALVSDALATPQAAGTSQDGSLGGRLAQSLRSLLKCMKQ